MKLALKVKSRKGVLGEEGLYQNTEVEKRWESQAGWQGWVWREQRPRPRGNHLQRAVRSSPGRLLFCRPNHDQGKRDNRLFRCVHLISASTRRGNEQKCPPEA